jgi:3-oxoacyl-[acyl-carrier protein] reductase
MDLGISDKKAIVCAASKGLGKACAISLAREGVDLTICARTPGPLEATAEEIQALDGGAVTAIACDITTDEGRDKILEQCANPDILINNAVGPPPGDFRN